MTLSTKQKTIVVGILISVIAISLISVAIAAYAMTSPVSDPLIVNPVPTPTPTPSPTPVPMASLSKVTFPTSQIYVGNSTTLTTIVDDGTIGLVVTFYNNQNVTVGATITDSFGVASITISPPQGTWTYYATASHT